MTQILERHAERLGLDEAGIERIDAAGREDDEQRHELRLQLREMEGEMRQLLSADSPDESAVMLQAERIGAVRIELQKLRLRGMLRVRALLTPEQRRELVEIHAETREQRGRRGPRGYWRRSEPGPPDGGP